MKLYGPITIIVFTIIVVSLMLGGLIFTVEAPYHEPEQTCLK